MLDVGGVGGRSQVAIRSFVSMNRSAEYKPISSSETVTQNLKFSDLQEAIKQK